MPVLTATRPRRRKFLRKWRRWIPWAGLALVVLLLVGVVAIIRSPLGQGMIDHAIGQTLAATARLGFVVSDIEVDGRETTNAGALMAALGAGRGTPILAVSPSRAKQQLEMLPWVHSAAVERHMPGTLFVHLVERKPLAVWQHNGRQDLIDRDGQIIAVDDLGRFARLPLVVGDDAARHAAALLDMLAAEPDLAARVTAAVRVGERRWNLRIDDAIDVLLPDKTVPEAWGQLARLERMKGLLKRDVQIVDMRLPDRLVVRVNAAPAKEASPKKARPTGKPT